MEEDIETCGWFVFYKDQLLIEKKNGMYTIPFGTEPPMPVPVGSTIHTIGEIEGHTAKTFSVHAPVPGCENDRHLMMDLRKLRAWTSSMLSSRRINTMMAGEMRG